jgi:formate hydrogenlyase subunit 6/NADH:ubiquinone oxidoreductase subunit I
MLTADPISTFGRSFGAIRLLLREGAYALPSVLWFSLAFLAVVLAFALLRGRRFCDWCPVGVALGCAARIAPFGVTMDRETCVACGLCERACPMNCVDALARTVDRARCVLCLSCAAACPNGSMRCGIPMRSRAGRHGKRRAFTVDAVRRAAGLALGLVYFGGRNARNVINAGLPAKAEGPVTISRILPPGALSESNYESRCVACGACVAACPVGVVKIADSPHPQLDYSGDYCQYSCTACGAVCPTAAIRHLTPDEKRRTRVALSKLHLDRCVVVTNSQACGACAEVCPTHALVMEPYGGAGSGLTIPVYDEQYCIGCGACLYACPAEPRAFTLTGLAEQTRTEGIRPDSDAERLPPLPAPPGEGDFPF